MKKAFRWGAAAVLAVLGASAAATVLMFPWNVDPARDESPQSREYYEQAYAAASSKGDAISPDAPLTEKEQAYVEGARGMAYLYRVPELIRDFVQRYGLENKKVLEVGAGSGLLQDAVADYTALDISSTARRFFHKPYIEASATHMPFPDSTFDALWSIWVLEHIPNPEKALQEMRRVVKPGGYLFLYPALDVSRYAAQGYHARPYKDLDWKGRLLKASIPIADGKPFHLLYFHQTRVLRSLGTRLTGGPSRFHFIRLTPNYDQYWEGDSDATTSLSNHELYLWFTTRGDVCVNCPSESRLTFRDYPLNFLIIRRGP
ncbi:MAG: class I SAM-dependent methyltransferase [Acidobacteriia bacterium]|nr:class I SAM-dependent methyltransferase [Terriglobia bacterium]